MTTINQEILDLEAAAKRFVEENYYRTFDANRADLVNLYQEDSVLVFNGRKIRGKEAILAKFTSLPFQQCQHHIDTIVSLNSGDNGGAYVVITGDIRLDGNQDALSFIQMFHLMPTPQGSFYVWYDFFRMNSDWGHEGHLEVNNRVTPFIFGNVPDEP